MKNGCAYYAGVALSWSCLPVAFARDDFACRWNSLLGGPTPQRVILANLDSLDQGRACVPCLLGVCGQLLFSLQKVGAIAFGG